MSLVSFMETVRAGIRFLRENSDKKALLVTHYDTDGLTSGYIMTKLLEHLGIDYDIQIVPFISKINIGKISKDYELYVFSDIGSGQIELIENHLGEKKIVVFDHHPYDKKPKYAKIVNPTDFGYDSQSDMCAAGLAYTAYRLIKGFDEKILWIAITGTVGDVQDAGNSIKGLNREILMRDAEKKSEFIIYDEDLPRAPYLFSRPLWYIITYNYILSIPGLYQNKQNTIEELTKAGFDPYVRINELPAYDQKRFYSWIRNKLKEQGIPETGKFGEFVNFKYDSYDIRFHARTFASYINSAGRIEKYEDVFKAFETDDVEMLVYASNDAKNLIHEVQNAVQNAKIIENDKIAIAFIEGPPASFSGLAANMLSSMKNKIGVVGIKSDGFYKVSGRAQGKPPISIGEMFRQIGEKYNLDGGGHENAGGIVLPDNEDAIEKLVRELLKQ